MSANSGLCPCKHCENKGCGSYHDICEKYKQWRELIDRRNEAERIHHKNNDTMSEDKKRALWRSKRYQRQTRYKHHLGSM